MHANARREDQTRSLDVVPCAPNEPARRRLFSVRGEPLFYADWERVVFIHYEVSAAALQRDVPFALDCCDDKAYVSLVAFTMRGLQPRMGGRLGALLLRPISTHAYLNVRTYVRCRGEAGIYFLTEWLPNPLSVRLGSWPFGLPYRLGVLDYQHAHELGRLSGVLRERRRQRSFAYRAQLRPDTEFRPCAAGSLDEFLMERYTAFTWRHSKSRFFRIWHEPWPQTRIELEILESSLLAADWEWFAKAHLVGANYSPGARNVLMGWPHRIGRLPAREVRSAFLKMP